MTSNDEPGLPVTFPTLTRAEVDACRTASWHNNFRAHTPKTRLLQLPQALLEYLEADGLVVPVGSDSAEEPPQDVKGASDSDSDSEESETWSFPELDRQIRQVLEDFEAVFPKFTWSAPQVRMGLI